MQKYIFRPRPHPQGANWEASGHLLEHDFSNYDPIGPYTATTKKLDFKKTIFIFLELPPISGSILILAFGVEPISAESPFSAATF
jgi:hypothetical protein